MLLAALEVFCAISSPPEALFIAAFLCIGSPQLLRLRPLAVFCVCRGGFFFLAWVAHIFRALFFRVFPFQHKSTESQSFKYPTVIPGLVVCRCHPCLFGRRRIALNIWALLGWPPPWPSSLLLICRFLKTSLSPAPPLSCSLLPPAAAFQAAFPSTAREVPTRAYAGPAWPQSPPSSAVLLGGFLDAVCWI